MGFLDTIKSGWTKPRIWEDPGEMHDAGVKWINAKKAKGEPPTITGLAIALGFASRQSIYHLSKEPKFAPAINRLRLYIENVYEEQLTTARNPAGAIFYLKNVGWQDNTSVTHNGKLSLSLADAIEAGRRAVIEDRTEGEVIDGEAVSVDG